LVAAAFGALDKLATIRFVEWWYDSSVDADIRRQFGRLRSPPPIDDGIRRPDRFVAAAVAVAVRTRTAKPKRKTSSATAAAAAVATATPTRTLRSKKLGATNTTEGGDGSRGNGGGDAGGDLRRSKRRRRE
jgi:hypothetical protein